MYKVSLLDSQGLTPQEKGRKLLEAACLPGKENVLKTRDEAIAYVKAAVEQCKTELTLVYQSETALHNATSIQSYHYSDLSAVSCTSQVTIRVDGQIYTICSYKLEYRAVEDKFKAYLEADGKNLASSNEEADAYLRERLKERAGQTDKFYVVYGPNAQIKEKEEIQSIAEANGAVVKSVNQHFYRKSYQGQTWTAVEYSIVYESTLEEFIASSADFKAYPEAGQENLFDIREEGVLEQIKALVEEAVEETAAAGGTKTLVYLGICADSITDMRAAMESLRTELEAEGYDQCFIEAPGSSGKTYENGVIAVQRVTVRHEQTTAKSAAAAAEENAVELETENAVKAETKDAAEVETESAVEAETESAVESETESAAGAETESAAVTETESVAGAETDSAAGAETENAAETETESAVEAEAENAVETESAAEPDVETEEASEPEEAVKMENEITEDREDEVNE